MTQQLSQSELNRKVTKADVERWRSQGEDHWMFDEMEFNELKQGSSLAATSTAKEKIERAGLVHLIVNDSHKGNGFQIIGGFPKSE